MLRSVATMRETIARVSLMETMLNRLAIILDIGSSLSQLMFTFPKYLRD